MSVSTCGELIHGGGLIFGGAYSRRFTVDNSHYRLIFYLSKKSIFPGRAY